MGRQPAENPIHRAIRAWSETIDPDVKGDVEGDGAAWLGRHIEAAPKRFIIYRPMVQLPAGSFAQQPWAETLALAGDEARSRLWALILGEVSKRERGGPLTNLAVVEGIPLHKSDGAGGEEEENILRSPSGLRMLYGDFGPSESSSGGGSNPGAGEPGEEDFDRAFWVTTKQNGLWQTWAPRWTMFSRGNVKEKARLLRYDGAAGGSAQQQQQWAVDLYAGIGYFVFSYAALGYRLLCWELNPWSVEGLRRGAEANRWSVRVVQGEDLRLPMSDVLGGGERIVVFLEDNREALGRIRAAQEGLGVARDIRHVNCGFLPTSEPTWRMAFDMTDRTADARLHLHENVGVDDTKARGEEIEERIGDWAAAEGGAQRRKAETEHVELVKTYAPGVWHCVFDVRVKNASTGNII
ncbi:hypothetical protein N3K66_003851 [Trichothecium roseum]|uniref:Uncharacterized protein n=1 Tax=Trichothecium roseum TaxID=47278 RepID=A0ACC0V6P5_9HYPO|nr:hypothetical protein N3K66_003851 [Trichothecium roseum]